MSAAMLVTAFPADMLGGIISVKAAGEKSEMLLNASTDIGTAITYTADQTIDAFAIHATDALSVAVDGNTKVWMAFHSHTELSWEAKEVLLLEVFLLRQSYRDFQAD